MSDWAVGDLAVCVDAGPCRCCGMPFGIARGEVRKVLEISPTGLGGPGLWFELPVPDNHEAVGGSALRFRKIRPDEHEACESEFVDLLETFKRKVLTETIVTVDRDGRAYLREAA